MKYSRREFIKLGGLAIGLATAVTNRGFGGTVSDALARQNFDSFKSLVGSEFTFYRVDSASPAILTKVQMFGASRKKPRGECFSLEFEMPSEDFVQDKYEMFHPSIGKFELLAVPGKSENGAPLLIAVINRL